MFSRVLELMGSLYASATGTAVVQLKDIPQRPREFDGKVVMLPEEGLAVKELESASLAFVAESCLRKARNELARFGTVLEVEVSEQLRGRGAVLEPRGGGARDCSDDHRGAHHLRRIQNERI